MAKYKVTANSGLNVRTGPGTSNSKVGAYVKGTIFEAPNDEKSGGWLKITSPTNGWACLTYLTCVEPQSTVQASASATIAAAAADTTLTSTAATAPAFSRIEPTTPTEDERYLKYIRAFGCPPQFTKFADPPIYTANANNTKILTSCGRVYAETLLTSPSILSISPCTIKYLPGWSTQQKDDFFTSIMANIGDSNIANKMQGDQSLSGKLYEAVPDYNGFMNHCNCVLRIAAIMMGLGDTYMPGTSVPLKEFDYSYFTTTREAARVSGQGIFSELAESAANAATAYFNDNEYIHFFLTQGGTSTTESISNSTEATAIENAVSNSGLDDITKNISLLTGFTDPDTNFEDDINQVFSSTDSNFLKSFASMAGNYLKGGRLVFPKMLAGSDYDKSISASCTFISPYATKLGIFLYCTVPSLTLFCLTVPKQIAESMYSIPYLCRVFQSGNYNSDLSAITGMDIKRGGSDDTAWTVDGLSTVWECSFTIVPMYNKMMMPSAKHPFLAFGNSAMLEYLGVICGINLATNNLNMKITIAQNLLQNRFKDIPTNLGRSIIDYATKASSFKKFSRFIN